jgi:hypothetical protein
MSKKPFLSKLLPVLLLFSGAFAHADTVKLVPDHPDRYVVMRGDTLWDISARFLEDPWKWPEIWHINPEIANPHLIYPGDIIRLEFLDGKPVLRLERPAGTDLRTVKLSPTARTTVIDNAIPTIPIVTQKELDDSPYIVASSEDRLISGTGNKIYARGISNPEVTRYDIVRRGEVYRNPDRRGDILGYEAIHVGYATVIRAGDPATLIIDQSDREVLAGDRLLPIADEEIGHYFLPRAPKENVDGRILSVLDGLSRIGQYQVVSISRGASDGLEPGHVLAVHQTGETVRDNFTSSRFDRSVRLPNERAGTVMLIRVFDRISYALIMEAARDLRVLDTVTTP